MEQGPARPRPAGPRPSLRQRLAALDAHLKVEQPHLLPVLRGYCDADRLLRRIGLLARGEALATRTHWWPLVTLLGPAAPLHSAFVGDVQSGASARPADGRPTILCFGRAAMASDPRIPFDHDEAFRVEASDSERLRGRILVDMAGAAAEPAGAVVGLSDLLLVFADAGQPEPDAIQPWVATASRRADARKIVTIRTEADLAGIDARLDEAGAACRRRIAGLIDALAEELEGELIPYIEASLERWRRGVRRGTRLWLVFLVLVLGGAVLLGGPENLPAFAGWLLDARPVQWGGVSTAGVPLRLLALLAGVAGLWLAGRLWVRRAVAQRIAANLPTRMGEAELDPRRAFLKSAGLFRAGVAGWGRRARRRLAAIRAAVAAEGER